MKRTILILIPVLVTLIAGGPVLAQTTDGDNSGTPTEQNTLKTGTAGFDLTPGADAEAVIGGGEIEEGATLHPGREDVDVPIDSSHELEYYHPSHLDDDEVDPLEEDFNYGPFDPDYEESKSVSGDETDGSGADEVKTEMVELELTGSTSDESESDSGDEHDGSGADEVKTEMVELDLTGKTPVKIEVGSLPNVHFVPQSISYQGKLWTTSAGATHIGPSPGDESILFPPGKLNPGTAGFDTQPGEDVEGPVVSQHWKGKHIGKMSIAGRTKTSGTHPVHASMEGLSPREQILATVDGTTLEPRGKIVTSLGSSFTYQGELVSLGGSISYQGKLWSLSSFTYQGQLEMGTDPGVGTYAPTHGTYDVAFDLQSSTVQQEMGLSYETPDRARGKDRLKSSLLRRHREVHDNRGISRGDLPEPNVEVNRQVINDTPLCGKREHKP